MRKKSKRQIQYETNKSAKVGDSIICPICGTEITKKSYQQAFCCGKCKDTYWNIKKDRHSKGYYRRYNQAHPERYGYLLGLGITASEREEMEALHRYATDKDFRDYVNQFPVNDEAESMMCHVDLSTELKNYEEQFRVCDFD